MPPIPRIIRQEDVNLAGSQPNASAEVYGSQVGEGLQAVGQGMEAAAARLRRDKLVEDKMNADSAFAEVQLRYEREQLEKELNTSGEIPGYHQDITGRLLKDSSDLANTLQTKEARQYFSEKMNAFRQKVDLEAYHLERTRWKTGRMIQSGQIGKDEIATLVSNPSQINFDKQVEGVNKRKADLAAIGVRQDLIEQQASQEMNQIAETQIEAITQFFGPETAIKRIKGGAYNGMMPADQLSRKIGQLEAQQRTSRIADGKKFADAMANAKVKIQKEGPSSVSVDAQKAAINEFFKDDPDRAEAATMEMMKDREEASMQFEVGNEFYNDPTKVGEIEKKIDAFENNNDASLNADERQKISRGLRTFLADEQKSLYNDNYAFFNDRPEAYPDLARLNSAIEKDPNNMALRRQKHDYIRAWQRDIGFAESESRAMGIDEAKSRVAQIDTIRRERPADIIPFFKQMKEEFGPEYMPQAVNNMKSEKMNAIYAFVAEHLDSPYVGELAVVAAYDDEKLKTLISTSDKESALEDAINSNPKFIAMQTDMSPLLTDDDRLSRQITNTDAIRKYALYLSKHNPKIKFKDAVKSVMDKIGPVGVSASGDFTFPRDVPPEHYDDIDRTSEQLKYEYAEFVKKDERILEALGLHTSFGVTDKELLGEDVSEVVARNIKFKTSMDGKHLNPWIEAIDGRMLEIRAPNGQLAEHAFQQLAAPIEQQYFMNSFATGKAFLDDNSPKAALKRLQREGMIPKNRTKVPFTE